MFRRTDKVKNIREWRLWIILLFELIGTALLVFLLIAPSALNLAANTTWYADIFDMFVAQAVWIAGSILVVTILFGWVSADANPVVTLARVARGQRNGQQAFWIISFQMIGAFAAAYGAFYLGNGHLDLIFSGATTATDGTLGSLLPMLQLSGNEIEWFGNLSWVIANVNPDGFIVFAPIAGKAGIFNLWATSGADAYAFLAITFAMEALLTWIFLSALVGSKKENKNSRVILTFIVLVIILTIGAHTNNVSLNPVRTLAPAIIAVTAGSADPLYIAYAVFFVAGQLVAVLLVAKGFAKRNNKAIKSGKAPSRLAIVSGSNVEAFKAEVKASVLAVKNELSATKGKYKWALEGNDPIETMGKEDLLAAIKANKADKTLDLEADIKVLRNEFALFLATGGDKGYKAAKAEEAEAQAAAEKAAKEEANPKKAGKGSKKVSKKEAAQAEKEAKAAEEKEAKKKPSKK